VIQFDIKMSFYVCVMHRTKVACVTKKASHPTQEREVSVGCVLVALSLCFVFVVHTTLAYRPHYTVFRKKGKVKPQSETAFTE